MSLPFILFFAAIRKKFSNHKIFYQSYSVALSQFLEGKSFDDILLLVNILPICKIDCGMPVASVTSKHG